MKIKYFLLCMIVASFTITCNVFDAENEINETIDFEVLEEQGWEITKGDNYISNFSEGDYKGEIIVLGPSLDDIVDDSEFPISNFYIFQQTETDDEIFTKRHSEVITLFRGGKLFVYSPNAGSVESYHLQYNDNPRSEEELKQYVISTFDKIEIGLSEDQVTVHEGYGLSTNSSTSVQKNELVDIITNQTSLIELIYTQEQLEFAKSSIYFSDGCTAGGPGSTSCSTSGCPGTPSDCSTSCSNGYSCCKCEIGGDEKAVCTCETDDNPGEGN